MTDERNAHGANGTFWASLRPGERATITRSATRKHFDPHAVLCRQGEESQHVLIVLSGHVKVTHSAAGGREIVTAVRGPGDILGELAAVDASPRAATLVALEPVEALMLTGSRFAALCQTEQRIAWLLLGVLARRMRDVGEQWAEFGGGSALQRIIALLLDLAIRHGKKTPSGIEIRTPATQQELAATVAASRESMSRVLGDLRKRGLISTGRGWITIHHMAGLRSLAN
jgi:CRP-like cAMP-binding protein